MRSRGWLIALAASAFAFAAGPAALAQQPYSPNTTLPLPPATPLGEAALPPPRAASALPNVAAPPVPNDSQANAAFAQATAGQSSGWLSGFLLDAGYLYLRPHSQANDYAIANMNNTDGERKRGQCIFSIWRSQMYAVPPFLTG